MTATAVRLYWLRGDTYGDFTLRGRLYPCCPVNHVNRMAYVAGRWVRFEIPASVYNHAEGQ